MARNDYLRAARERTASPQHPHEGLSRQELAELVNEYIWEHHRKRVELDANYIGKLERGVIRWPCRLYREAFRAILNAPSDAALGFVNPRRSIVRRPANGTGDVDSSAKVADAEPLSGMAVLLNRGDPTTVPSRVTPHDIEQITAVARVFSSWDHAYGGGLAREAVIAQLRWSSQLLNTTVPSDLRSPLLSGLGYLAHTCGFMAFDACAHRDARRLFTYALACAEEAQDWHLRAKVLSSMARQSIWLGRPDDGLTLAEHALVRADRLTATERAMLHTARARALSQMRRVGETLTAVGTADENFADRRPDADPPWTAYYDQAQHAGDTGHALFDLAMTGRCCEEARTRLAAAVAGHTADYVRSRVIAQTKLASLTMVVGDPAEATAFGAEALRTASALRSRRVADDLRALARYSNRHTTTSEVRELQRHIHLTVLAM